MLDLPPSLIYQVWLRLGNVSLLGSQVTLEHCDQGHTERAAGLGIWRELNYTFPELRIF